MKPLSEMTYADLRRLWAEMLGFRVEQREAYLWVLIWPAGCTLYPRSLEAWSEEGAWKAFPDPFTDMNAAVWGFREMCKRTKNETIGSLTDTALDNLSRYSPGPFAEWLLLADTNRKLVLATLAAGQALGELTGNTGELGTGEVEA